MDNRQLEQWVDQYEQDLDFRKQVDQDENHPFRLQASQLYQIMAGLTGLQYQNQVDIFLKTESDIQLNKLLPERWEWYQKASEHKLSPEEKQKFEQVLAQNQDLNTEFAAYLATEKSLFKHQHDLQKINMLSHLETIEEIPKQNQKRPPGKMWTLRWIGIAASMLVLVALGISFWPQNEINISNEFIAIEELSFRDQSATSSQLVDINIENLDTWIQREDSAISLAYKNLVGADLHIEYKNYSRAIEYLDNTIESGDKRYLDIALWNKALCLALTGESSSARTILEEFKAGNNELSEKAEMIIQTLN